MMACIALGQYPPELAVVHVVDDQLAHVREFRHTRVDMSLTGRIPSLPIRTTDESAGSISGNSTLSVQKKCRIRVFAIPSSRAPNQLMMNPLKVRGGLYRKFTHTSGRFRKIDTGSTRITCLSTPGWP
ncbi:unnamed protein product [Prorocentrum cordatum]|uniref:Uncharacterized protein n=1 Tax=Prorocentrum cordatum TaxID=2364126 RepID=A0ABN9RDW8_9DINO|nr:unnamed protein product [Polarella glacialis]